jgi:hypothetical protein
MIDDDDDDDDDDKDDCGAIGVMTGRENRSTQRKPTPVPLCPPQISQISLRCLHSVCKLISLFE